MCKTYIERKRILKDFCELNNLQVYNPEIMRSSRPVMDPEVKRTSKISNPTKNFTLYNMKPNSGIYLKQLIVRFMI